MLSASALRPFPHLAQVDRQLVEHDEHRAVAEQFAQGLGAGGGAIDVGVADALVAGAARQGVGDLAPGGEGQRAVRHAAAVGGGGVLAVEGGRRDGFGGDQRGVQELRRVGDALHAGRCVDQGDRAVGFAAAEGRVEPEDRGHGRSASGEPGADVGHQVLEAAGGIGVGEEAGGTGVFRGAAGAAHDVGQVCGEVAVAGHASLDVGTGSAKFEDGLRHR